MNNFKLVQNSSTGNLYLNGISIIGVFLENNNYIIKTNVYCLRKEKVAYFPLFIGKPFIVKII